MDESRLPVPDARVVIRSALTGTDIAFQHTGQDGSCIFDGLNPGRVSILSSKAGLREAGMVVTLKSGPETLTATLHLGLEPKHDQVTVVSPSRIEEAQDESPVKVDVVTRSQILDTGFVRLSDVLAEIPGVVVQTGSAVQGGEQINGVDSRQVAVLRDGLPLIGARGIKEGLIDLTEQPTNRVEQVEVVKGATSTMYGSDAIGGVINQITREAVHPLQADAYLLGGSLGSIDGGGSFGARWNNLNLFLSGSHQQVDPFRLIPASPNTVGPDTSFQDGLARLSYTFGPRARLSFRGDGYHNRATGENFTETGLAQATSNNSTQGYALTGDFVLSPSTTFQTRGYLARYDESDLDISAGPPPVAVAGSLSERYQRLDSSLIQQVGAWQLLQGGVEWTQDRYKGVNRLVGDDRGQQVTTADYWLQDRLQLGPRVTLTLGGRITNNSMFGVYAVPKLGLLVRLTPRLLLRGSFGRGFRAPTVGELYYHYLHPESGYQVIGNPNLEPETSRSFSTGMTYRFDRVRLTFDLFRNDIRNLIETGQAGFPQTSAELAQLFEMYQIPASYQAIPGLFTFLKVNRGQVFTEGLETGVEVSPFRNFALRGAYAYLQAVDENSGQFLSFRFRHQGSFQAAYSSSRTGITTNLRGTFFSTAPVVSLRSGPPGMEYGYALWNFYASKTLPGGLQMFGALDNLFNSTDQNLMRPQPTYYRADYGRTWRLGMRWQWNKD
jgi:outer membrane receptor for ferrienterochelin and colicins